MKSMKKKIWYNSVNKVSIEIKFFKIEDTHANKCLALEKFSCYITQSSINMTEQKWVRIPEMVRNFVTAYFPETKPEFWVKTL